MTFVLGLECSDGFVLCADSLESDGYTKKRVPKIDGYVVGGEWGVLMGAAGPSGIVDSFWDKLKDVLGNDAFDRAAIESKIEKAYNEMRSAHPDQDDWFQCIFGIFNRNELDARLYKTESGCLARKRRYVCAGFDATLANFVLAPLYKSPDNIEAAKLGFLVTSLMCEHADSVDGPVQIIGYEKGHDDFTNYASAMPFIMQQIKTGDVYRLLREYWETRK